ncbi:hypothetical protein B0H13DRAFT_1883446 [Mycena leptocephala]|nr:hypothetical protein B0H13DRAFT_1883446 [Mycena leptocephala]
MTAIRTGRSKKRYHPYTRVKQRKMCPTVDILTIHSTSNTISNFTFFVCHKHLLLSTTPSKETQYLHQRCFNCHTTKPLSWHRSTLNPGKVVYDKCGLYKCSALALRRAARGEQGAEGRERHGLAEGRGAGRVDRHPQCSTASPSGPELAAFDSDPDADSDTESSDVEDKPPWTGYTA